ncbi:MAG: hypothetical protein F6K56_03035 [Moorea sp. SIO3G5]|nr:hypothetical protein [Moorena sp. SIO3G5]
MGFTGIASEEIYPRSSQHSTFQPSNLPTFQPSNLPTFQPSNLPTFQPSNLPTFQPSNLPTHEYYPKMVCQAATIPRDSNSP